MLYHGTSTIYKDDILSNGLTVKNKNQFRHYNHYLDSDFDSHSLHSMSGIYLTKKIKTAQEYADLVAQKTGGELLILEIYSNDQQLIVDEDHIPLEYYLKEYLRSEYMSTDNDGFFQLKNMIRDIDTGEDTLDSLRYWITSSLDISETSITNIDIEKIVSSYINRMASHCYQYELALNFLYRNDNLDIAEMFESGHNSKELIKKYEERFLNDFEEFIISISPYVIDKSYVKNIKTISDIEPENIKIFKAPSLIPKNSF